MAGLLRRAMVYLGLVDDDYDDYEAYDEVQAAPPVPASPPPAPTQATRPVRAYAPPEPAYEPAQQSSAIRTIPREPPPPPEPPPQMAAQPTRSPVVRAITPVQSAKVFVVAPASFNDAKEIGDRLKASQPVIVNLQAADADLVRRLIDFCSGLSYGLAGAMEKVADRVFLLTPTNVEVSAEERRRLQERGLYQT